MNIINASKRVAGRAGMLALLAAHSPTARGVLANRIGTSLLSTPLRTLALGAGAGLATGLIRSRVEDSNFGFREAGLSMLGGMGAAATFGSMRRLGNTSTPFRGMSGPQIGTAHLGLGLHQGMRGRAYRKFGRWAGL